MKESSEKRTMITIQLCNWSETDVGIFNFILYHRTGMNCHVCRACHWKKKNACVRSRWPRKIERREKGRVKTPKHRHASLVNWKLRWQIESISCLDHFKCPRPRVFSFSVVARPVRVLQFIIYAGETRTEWKTKETRGIRKHERTREKRTKYTKSRGKSGFRTFSALSACTTDTGQRLVWESDMVTMTRWHEDFSKNFHQLGWCRILIFPFSFGTFAIRWLSSRFRNYFK